MMEYKGYIAEPKYDPDDKTFTGIVQNIVGDVIHFEGRTPEEFEQAFKDSVEDYLEFCKEDGIEPQRPYSGKFMIRISPELHGKAALVARKHHKSLNALIAEAIQRMVDE